MENYIALNGKRIGLTDEQVREIEKAFCSGKETCDCESNGVKLSEVEVGETFGIGGYEFIVLEHCADLTRIILKDLLPERTTFGENNNFADEECAVRKRLESFASKLGAIVGDDNIVTHEVDLTSDDGLNDYGRVEAKMSLLTCNLYRKYVRTLDKYKVDAWWWLVTPYSTPAHEDANWVKCVSPSGRIDNYYYDYYYGVRPFCILKSNIFVSK